MEDSLFELYNSTIAALYRANSTPESWQPFLGCFRTLVDADTISLALGDPFGEATILICSDRGNHCFDGGAIRQMLEASPFSALADGQVVNLNQLIPEAELEQHAFYQQYMAPYDLFHMLGANLWNDNNLIAYFRLTRPRRSAAFSQQETVLCASLIPHIKQALGNCRRMDINAPAYTLWLQQLERKGWGEVVLDRSGKVRQTSEIARKLLRSDSSPLVERQGQLKAYRHDMQLTLKSQMEHVLASNSSSMMRLPDRSGGGYHWQLLLYPQRGLEQDYLIVYLNPEQSALKLSAETLKSLFSLTRAESAVCLSLAEGNSIEEIATKNQLSVNTVRSHTRIAMAKIGVNRQAALVSKILMSVAMSGR